MRITITQAPFLTGYVGHKANRRPVGGSLQRVAIICGGLHAVLPLLLYNKDLTDGSIE
jgi:hypothetical protein